MPTEMQIPEWLQRDIDAISQSDDWPHGKYPRVAVKARNQLANRNDDDDSQVALLQLVIDRVERLRPVFVAAQTALKLCRDGMQPLIQDGVQSLKTAAAAEQFAAAWRDLREAAEAAKKEEG